jgi:uncharacterized Zn finger protein
MSLFDTDAWRERMDERWFDTGAAMAEAGAVDLVSIEDDEKVTAHVTGSVGDLYVVELRAPAGEGACTCPGFEKFGACKHQAAVVTAANAADLSKVRDRMARLRDGLPWTAARPWSSGSWNWRGFSRRCWLRWKTAGTRACPP